MTAATRSVAAVYTTGPEHVRRLFVAYQASIAGLRTVCRQLLGLEGTHLRSKCVGTLLAAAAVDGKGALFPLAIAVVDANNYKNWLWFLIELRTLLEANSPNLQCLTFLPDLQKGLIDGVQKFFSDAFQGFCMRHLSENFQKVFKNVSLMKLLCQAAYASTDVEFDTKMSEIEEISIEAKELIVGIAKNLCANSTFEGERFGHLTFKIAESLSD
uniref:MULE transposase domain-containing protein n=1 Tax=Peronospora matthiolae TaxID=2874970 RepID=A0AAV1VBQ9_9STRA